MSKNGTREITHVTGSIEKNIDVDHARLSFENRGEKATMVVNLSKSFFFNEKGAVLSYSAIHSNCAAMGADYGFDKFTLA